MSTLDFPSLISVVLLGLLPSATWLIFYLQEDRRHPEPLHMILYAFILGGFMTFFALVVELLFRQYIFANLISAHHPIELLVFAGIEELLKFFAVFWFIAQRPDFDEPMDAMIYMVTVALGFAAIENIASLGQDHTSLITGLSHIAPLEVLALRFFGATLLHSLAGAIIGYHWAHEIAAKKKNPTSGILHGLAIAILLHAAFNYLILITGPLTWALSFVLFIGFFVLADFEKLKADDYKYDT